MKMNDKAKTLGELLAIGHRKFRKKSSYPSSSILCVAEDGFRAVIIERSGRKVPLELNYTMSTKYLPLDEPKKRKSKLCDECLFLFAGEDDD